MIRLAGIEDPLFYPDETVEEKISPIMHGDTYTILLSHRPELTKEYTALAFDAVVCGHAHGGQWRLPGLINGVYAPHQGIFPKFAGGLYDLGTTTLIVSRGLARETTLVPRIFNRPELVIMEIQ